MHHLGREVMFFKTVTELFIRMQHLQIWSPNLLSWVLENVESLYVAVLYVLLKNNIEAPLFSTLTIVAKVQSSFSELKIKSYE